MTTFQKFLALSALVFSLSFAYYFFFYVPKTREINLRKQAVEECQKSKDENFKIIFEHVTERTMDNAVQSFNKIWPPNGVEVCADFLIDRWKNN